MKAQLLQNVSELSLLWSETLLLAGAVALLIVGLLTTKSWVIRGAFLIVLGFSAALQVGSYFDGAIVNEALVTHKINAPAIFLFCLTAALVVLFKRANHSLEFYFMVLSMVVGAAFLVKSNSILVFFIAFELLSFVGYILTNFSFRSAAHEAALKYLLFGALSAVALLLGLVFLYYENGSIFFQDYTLNSSLLSQTGFFLMLTGMFFKISIFPMHIWVPATYQSGPNDAIAMLSTIPKMAGFVFLYRLSGTLGVELADVEGQVILVLGIMTILLGTLGALLQTNVRRMISFGAIAQSGFLLPFVLIQDDQAFFWYLVAYALMNVIVFRLIDQYEAEGTIEIADYKRLKPNIRMVLFTLVLLSLVGIPPMAGFTAKFFLFAALFEYAANQLVLIFLLTAVFSTVLSLFFYLKVPYVMIQGENRPVVASRRFSTNIIAGLFVLILLFLFFVPESLTLILHIVNK